MMMACTLRDAKMPCRLRAPHGRSTSTCRPLHLRSRSAGGPIRCNAHQGGKQLSQSMAAALAAAVLMVQPVAAASLKETAGDQVEKATTQLERLFKKVEQSQGDSPLDPERKGKPFGVGDPDFKLKAPLTGESTRKASKYSVGPTVQGDNPRLPAPLPRAARPGPSPAPVKIFSGEGGEAAQQGQKGEGTLQEKGSAPAPQTSEDKAESKREADTVNFAAKSSPNSAQQKQPPQVAPETAPSPANVANPLKNLPVPSDPAAPVSQSAQETLSEKGGAAADTVKKAADEAPSFFDRLKGGLQKQTPEAAPEAASSSADAATDSAASASQSAKETVSEKGGAAADTVKKAADEAPSFFDRLKGGLQKQTPEAAPEAASSSADAATDSAASASQSAKEAVSEKGGAAADTVKKAADEAPSFFDRLKGGLQKQTPDAAPEAASSSADAATDSAASASQSAKETVSEKGGAAADTVKKAADEAPSFFDRLKGGLQKQTPDAAPEAASSSADAATDSAASASQSAKEAVSEKGGAAADTVKKAADEAPSFFDRLKGGLQKQTPEAAPEAASSSADAATDSAASASQSAKEAVSEKGGAAADTVKKAADEAPSFFDLLKGGLQKQTPEAAPEAASSSADVATDSAASASQSAKEAVSEKGGAAANAAKKAADEAPSFFDLLKGGLQKQTPEAAPEAASSSAKAATDSAASAPQSAKETVSEKGGAAVDTVKKAADQAPSFFDLLREAAK